MLPPGQCPVAKVQLRLNHPITAFTGGLTRSERSVTEGVGPLAHGLVAVALVHDAALDVGAVVRASAVDGRPAVLGARRGRHADALGLVHARRGAGAVAVESSRGGEREQAQEKSEVVVGPHGEGLEMHFGCWLPEVVES